MSESKIDTKVLSGMTETWNVLYGYKYTNIPYDINGKIPNTFKKNDENYNIDIGNVNDGKDYDKTPENVYDLYLPYSVYKDKKIKGIFVFFHGLGSTKNDVEWFCSRYAKCGYVTVAIETTNLENCKDKSIFRTLDETTICLQSMKNKLNQMLSIHTENLKMAIGGISAGGYNALLYAYSMAKKSPIPIKFVINCVAQVTMEPYAWYSLSNIENPLDDLNNSTINKAIKEGRLIPSNNNEFIYLTYMNFFIGNLYTTDQLKAMVNNEGKIITDSPQYKALLKIVEKCFPLYHIQEDSIPTISEYAGKDIGVSVVQCQYLINKLNEKKVPNDLVYMKNGSHYLDDCITDNGIESLRKMHYLILSYAEKYF
ncbi:hypothetical protein BCR32DRAFT_308873 [Anaeromyces robustus]|uniref:Alpha/beta-hydrolase n=1 Tax=Anaeromyces robustus TaxID=1754192 RepID=A0A1Y1XBB7_9FUNG|nr:hypothetical protein BCR32DRAFT_308873 [Anaeromyces robustus]|eukprot:ORX83022.1 hypothetical protein BCR32DRAFT_308873 [Anaeromyces robustus]